MTDQQDDQNTDAQVANQWTVVQDLTSKWGPGWAVNFDALRDSISQGVQ